MEVRRQRYKTERIKLCGSQKTEILNRSDQTMWKSEDRDTRQRRSNYVEVRRQRYETEAIKLCGSQKTEIRDRSDQTMWKSEDRDIK